MGLLAVVDRMRVIEVEAQITLPSGEAIPVASAVRADGTSGKAMIGNGSAAGEAGVFGLNNSPKVNVANLPVQVIKRGLVALYDANGANVLAGLNYGALVYVSDTDSRLADAAGTVPVIAGRVLPLWDQATPTKVLALALA
jgi:hypothetical protein